MKKIVLLVALLMLTSCSSKETEIVKETKICKTEDHGKEIQMQMDAENDVIKTMKISYLMPEAVIGKDVLEFSKEDLQELGDSILTQLGLKKDTEGIVVDIKTEKETIIIEMGFDLSKADASVLSYFGITGNTQNVKLSETVKNAQENSTPAFTCQ